MSSVVKKWVVYILWSTVTGKLYTGISNDWRKRLKAHNAGKGAKFTRSGRPWRLGYIEIVASKGDALRREHKIKQMSRARKLRLISALGLDPEAPLLAVGQET